MNASAIRVRSVVGVVAAVTCVAAAHATYTDARCPNCHRIVLAMPNRMVEVRTVTSAGPTGRGPVTICGRCDARIEVIGYR